MLDPTDWIAVATVAAPLIVKTLSDWQANAVANHNASLTRIIGMAQREAATIAQTLETAPAGTTPATLRQSLITSSAQNILTEMGDSASRVGADALKLGGIVNGELNKINASKKVI
jgi:hypothetical protein